jgi:prepilin-type N-terminal cleavage/methylation domain-containing protein
MLRSRHQQGFTLVELVVSMLMGLIVGGAVYHTLMVTQRLSRAHAQQVSVQSSVRSAALVLANEFRPLGAGLGLSGGQTDLVSIAPAAVSYRAERGFGVLCQPASAGRIRISQVSFSGHRDPQAGRDSVSVFIEGDPASSADDAWLPVAITAVGAGSCAGGGGAAIDLTVSPVTALEGLPSGTPVRIHELMELRLYQSEGRSWLGMRSVSSNESIQPLAGPMRTGDGVQLEYLGAAGLPTGVRSDVRGIRFTLHGESEANVNFGAHSGEPVTEELSTQVTLRNAVP